MTKEQFKDSMAYLGLAYDKKYTANELELHYDFLKEYSDETFMKAIKTIIRESRFLPKVNELVEMCDKYKERSRFEILDYMNERGYFKTPNELDKAIRFLETGVVPEWFKNDMNEYYKMMRQGALEYQNTKLLEV